ncbi:hypothetical protein [Agrobacterium rosae]|uniref:Uncharacterized protein n=1 Tax=Agrobacterium rosae TaxID=1972867 RepID=A0AAW9FSQ3_9HYPH|nr:hypothetical protein [Agrobacterium rosae]MDX8305890.1 hypothetical protein [Agrobacterium rosae]
MTRSSPTLSRRSIDILLDGTHADIGGRSRRTRGKNLLLIAASYSYSELLDEKGFGDATALEIRDWLLGHGLTLKADARDINSRKTG